MKRSLTFFLALVMLISLFALAACADKKDISKGSGTADQSDRMFGKVPEGLDFEGTEINFVYAENSAENFTGRSISVDTDDTSDTVDSKVAARNALVEQELNVKIVSTQKSEQIMGLRDAIKNQMDSGGDEIDVIAGYQYYDIGFATDGWLLNLNSLSDYGADYIDFDPEEGYWGSEYNDNLMYKNARYWITGDLSLRYIGGMYCTFVNETIYEKSLKNDYGSIYDLVRSGDWTLDMLTEMAGKCYIDNGTVPEKVDADDQLGYAWEPNDPLDGLAFSSMVTFSTKYPDESIKITFNNERTVQFIGKLEKLLTGPFSMNVGDQASQIVMPAFASGNVAFHVNKIFHAETHLLEMEDGYCIIPAPKFDKSQTDYITGVHDGCTIFGISYGCQQIPATAATLEAMASVSRRTVTPMYYDSAMKFKYTRDNDSAEMIDLIRKHVTTDFAAVWSHSINDIVHFFRTNYTSRVSSSQLQKAQKVYQDSLNKLLETLENDS